MKFGDLSVRAGLALAVGLLIAGCTTPPAPPPTLPPLAQPDLGAAGEVLGRSDRFIVYVPASDDTLRGIARRFLGDEDLDWQIADFNAITRAEPKHPLVVPLTAINPIGVQPDAVQTVPILCYHRFGQGGGKMVVSPANFAAQLEWLKRNDYRVIRLADLVAYLDGKQPVPKRAVVITIDDGYESVHRYALPLLRKYGYPATLFAYTDFIGIGDGMSWQQLQELEASGLVDVQAHSKTHRNLIERAPGETDERYRESLEAETRIPRDVLERRLSGQVRHYAFPYGDANEQVLEALKRNRYLLGVTVNPGGNAFYAQPYMLRRTMIFGDHDLDDFKARLQITQRLQVP